MSSGRCTNVARPAQYTRVEVTNPTHPSARAKSSVAPTGTSSPAPRSTLANATATRPISGRSASGPSTGASSTARHRGSDQNVEAVRAHAGVVLVILQDRPERRVNRSLVEPGRAEHGERLRPIDCLGDPGRLVELEIAQRLHRARDIASERV